MAHPPPHRRWPKGSWMRLLSPDTLRALMAQKGFSHRRLARYCELENGRSGMIDHLVSGRRTSCTPRLASRIAEALDVPLELLFAPSVPRNAVSPAKRREAA